MLGDSCEDLDGVGFSWKSEMNDGTGRTEPLKTSHSSKSITISWDSKLLEMLFTSWGRVDNKKNDQWLLVHISTAVCVKIKRDNEGF